MSFRDNLQHLRATRNMTQEQLAMLLGVSRQSVTKWEAERATPEMDKLLAICKIFGCSLDELVTGDLTGRAPEPTGAVPPGPPTDICGYDEHWKRFSFRIATGVALIILGGAATELVASWTEHTGGGAYLGYHPLAGSGMELSVDGLSAIPVLASVIAGLALIIPAAISHSTFEKAHPYVQDFYTNEDRERGARRLSAGLAGGIACIFGGVAVSAVIGEASAAAAGAAMLVLTAAGVWLLIHSALYWNARLDVEGYNVDAGGELTPEDARELGLGERAASDLLARRDLKRRKAVATTVIVTASTAVSLLWLFLGGYGGLMGEEMADLFWLPWMLACVLCPTASFVIDARGRGSR